MKVLGENQAFEQPCRRMWKTEAVFDYGSVQKRHFKQFLFNLDVKRKQLSPSDATRA